MKAALAIMTTDTFPKLSLKNFFIDKSEINIGGALNEYDADHFGEIIQPKLMVSEPYYFSKSFKKDGNIFIKYNRLVLFRADLWHSYGMGFGNELNNSMKHQKVLIKNV